MSERLTKLTLGFLVSVLISSCAVIPSRVTALKNYYDSPEYTHAYHWKAGISWENQCAFLYRDKRLDTPHDDWVPFYQILALNIGQNELNRRREIKAIDYDNELFSRDEIVENCREIDGVGFDGISLDHRQVALPEEAIILLNRKKAGFKKIHPEKPLDYLDHLRIHYDPNLF